MTGELPALLATLQIYNHRRAIYFYIIWKESKESPRKRTYAWIKQASDYTISQKLSWKYSLKCVCWGGGEAGGSDKDTHVSKR